MGARDTAVIVFAFVNNGVSTLPLVTQAGSSGSSNEESPHYGHLRGHYRALIPRRESCLLIFSLPLPLPSMHLLPAEPSAQRTKPPLRTGGWGHQEACGQSKPLTSPVFVSLSGSLRRRSLRTRQSSEDVYFSKSGEMQWPPVPVCTLLWWSHSPPQLCGGDGAAEGAPRARWAVGGGPWGFLEQLRGAELEAQGSSPLPLSSHGPFTKLCPCLSFHCRTTEALKDLCGPPHVRGPQPGGAQVHHRDPSLLCHEAEGHWSR